MTRRIRMDAGLLELRGSTIRTAEWPLRCEMPKCARHNVGIPVGGRFAYTTGMAVACDWHWSDDETEEVAT